MATQYVHYVSEKLKQAIRAVGGPTKGRSREVYQEFQRPWRSLHREDFAPSELPVYDEIEKISETAGRDRGEWEDVRRKLIDLNRIVEEGVAIGRVW